MDDPSIIVFIGPFLTGLLLIASAFFSSSETAIFSLTKLQVQRLRDEESFTHRTVLGFVDNPRRLLITSLVGNTFVNVAFATLVTSLALRVGENVYNWNAGTALSVATAASTLLLLLFGEIAPKTFALQHAERVAHWIAPPLWLVSLVLTPIRYVMRSVVDRVVQRFGGRGEPTQAVTEEEIRAVVNTGEEAGALRRDERQLIDRIFELRETMAKDIMVPRTEMVCVEADQTLGEVLRFAESVGHSRLPVYVERIDNIVGILNVKDYPLVHDIPDVREKRLAELMGTRELLRSEDGQTLIRPPLLLPETKRLDALLRDFAEEGTRMAILLDEYGGTAGLITTEDIIEEVVGEIIDEYDELIEPELAEEWTPEMLRDTGIQLPAKLSLRAAMRYLHTTFDTDVADTVGGYVYSLFGRVPKVGETIIDETGFEFHVTAMTGARIQRVRVRQLDLDDDAAEAEEE